jgi:hypothetical protein
MDMGKLVHVWGLGFWEPLGWIAGFCSFPPRFLLFSPVGFSQGTHLQMP